MLLEKLYEDTGGQGPSRDEAVFELINGVLDATTLEPNLHAALLRAAARHHPHKGGTRRGRPARRRPDLPLPPSDPTTWVFDPRTFT